MNMKKIILISVVGLTSAAIGILLPTMMSGGHGTASTDASHGEAKAVDPHATAADPHAKPADPHAKAADPHAKAADPHAKPADPHAKAADSHGGGHGGKDEKKVVKVGPVFLQFEPQVVVNLNEPGMVKFFSIRIVVQTDGKYEDEVMTAMSEKKALLLTFLTSHIADKTVEDVRGGVGVNKLRREIQDKFNLLLFKDGLERIQDVLFEEYHITSQ